MVDDPGAAVSAARGGRMNTNDSNDSQRSHKRERYLIDTRLQLSLALPLLATLGVVALAYVAAIYVIPGGSALKAMTAEETRALFLRANVVYFGIAAAAIVAVAIYLSHRIAGPAFVVERALRAMRGGDYGERLSLRPNDLLQPLAKVTTELRDALVAQDADRRQLVKELGACLDGNDLAGARELVAQLETGPRVGLPSDEDTRDS